LIDDEDMITDVCEMILSNWGYKVFIAKSGKEAIEIYKKNREIIDVAILDMIMPDMSGRETFKQLKEIDPDVKVILLSGYSIDDQGIEMLKSGCKGFIQKPFNTKELSHKLRAVIENR